MHTPMHRQRRVGRAAAFGFAAIAVVASTAAFAGGNLVLIDAPPSTSTLAMGAGVWSLPKYPGSRHNDTLVLPAFDYYASSGLFVSTDTGVGWNLSPSKEINAGVRLWPQFGRARKDAPVGLDSVPLRLQVQGYGNMQLGEAVLLQGALAYGAGRDRNGVQLEFGATSGIPLGDDLLGIGLSMSWANKAYRQSYFGISAREAAASGLAQTTLGSGRLDTNLTLSAEHKFNATWRLSGQLVWSRLAADVAHVPVTQDRTQTASTLTLWRAF